MGLISRQQTLKTQSGEAAVVTGRGELEDMRVPSLCSYAAGQWRAPPPKRLYILCLRCEPFVPRLLLVRCNSLTYAGRRASVQCTQRACQCVRTTPLKNKWENASAADRSAIPELQPRRRSSAPASQTVPNDILITISNTLLDSALTTLSSG